MKYTYLFGCQAGAKVKVVIKALGGLLALVELLEVGN